MLCVLRQLAYDTSVSTRAQLISARRAMCRAQYYIGIV